LTDGRGNVFENPIEHIAATNYPVVPGLGPWIPDSNDPMGLTFHKEVLPTGKYYKQSEELDFEITPQYLDIAISQFEAMRDNGVTIPFQLTHEGDGNQLGDVIQIYSAQRSRQLPEQKQPAGSLSKKNKAHVLRLAQERDNSNPNQLPNAGPFKMTPEEILAAVGVQLPENWDTLDDNGKRDFVVKALQQLGQQQAQQPEPAAASRQGQQQQISASQGQQNCQQNGDVQLSLTPQQLEAARLLLQGGNNGNGQQGQQNGLQPNRVTTTVQLSKAALNPIRDGYKAQLEALVMQGSITPAEMAAAEQKYLTDDKLALSLSGGQSEISAWIDAKRGENNSAWQPSGRSQASGQNVNITLSRSGGKSPLAAEREKRIQRAKEAAGR
jgi:hypothetical protein